MSNIESILDSLRADLKRYRADSRIVKHNAERDAVRLTTRTGLLDLLDKFQTGRTDVESFRSEFDNRTRTEWHVFGLKGTSGAMFLNKLVKHVPDRAALTAELKKVLTVPADEETARKRMDSFHNFLMNLVTSGLAKRQQLDPARTPFFVSAFWHMQNVELWPIFYMTGRQMLRSKGLYKASKKPIDDYFLFRRVFKETAATLDLPSWEFEHLLAWLAKSAPPPPPPPGNGATPPPDDPPSNDGTGHTQVQWLLATMGKKLGCRVWIASNDHSRTCNGGRLGDLSISELPNLGLGVDAQKTINLIDVLWLKGHNQVIAAFEVEHTTSIFSGLLRMADLAALAPNLAFPLYIVTPEERLPKVKNQLTRPSFQALELHQRCGFFSSESLSSNAEQIMKWASDPSAIDQLAERVGDTE